MRGVCVCVCVGGGGVRLKEVGEPRTMGVGGWG